MHWPRFFLAAVAASALVMSAPFLGQARSALRSAFPAQFVLIVGGMVAAGLLAAIAVAVARIRSRRLLRYSAIVLAIATAAIYALANASDNRDSDIVELFHFLQYGVVTLLFYRASRQTGDAAMVAVPLLAGLVVGTAEEWFQWFLPARVGEIRDLYLNLTAIACGLLFSLAVDPPGAFARSLLPGSASLIGRFAVAALLAVAAFFHTVHLGHAIADDEVGIFESRYSRERLLELQARRMAAWRVSPPPATLRRLSREDQYLTEGVQHAQERNRRWEAGDVLGAWNENRILETYYAPTLDVQSYAARSHLRWPDAQRVDAEGRAAAARAGNPGRAYVSRAFPYPIVAWRPVGLWVVVVALAGVTLLASAAAERRARPSR